jgi:CubicO group peptidase (beta-lactamase class C family)
VANVEDVSKWLRLQLGKGVFESKRLLSEAVVDEMHMAQVLFGGPPSNFPVLPDESAHFWAYGLGWFLTDYRGRKLVMHWGASSAFTALVPEENLGVAVLTNLPTITWLSPVDVHLNHLPSVLVLRVLEVFLGGPERDWSSEYLEKAEADSDPFRLKDRTRVLGTKHSAPLGDYVGTYAHPAFGEVIVTEDSGALVFHFPPYTTGDSHIGITMSSRSIGGSECHPSL